MFKKISFLFFLKLVFSEPLCEEGEKNCIKCNYLTKLCAKCKKDIYAPDNNGGCIGAKKCIIGKNYCNICSAEGDLCESCAESYFPDDNGGCSYSPNCAISEKGECIECLENFILVGKKSKDNLKICKSLNSEDLKNCEEIDFEKGVCSKCKENYFLNSDDYRCTKTQNCSESIYEICTKCDVGYYLDKKERKCKLKDNNFLYCKETLDGNNCESCDDNYFLSEDGKCNEVNFCSKVNENNQCEKCKSNYFLLSNYQYKACTITEYCSSGDSDTGLCLNCENGYYLDYKDGKCKSNQDNNEFKFCKKANGECNECIYGYFIGEDFKCSLSKNCAESNLGKCEVCSDKYYLGLDNICSEVEHCIYHNRYDECIECEGDYYYNIRDKVCVIGENNFSGCKITDNDGNNCAQCKSDYFLNQSDHTCINNNEFGEFYKCERTDSLGRFCVNCIENYYLSPENLRCSIINGCEITNEDDTKCLECNIHYALNLKTGKCEDNDIIEYEEKKYYYRCNKTNEEGTACGICMEGFTLNENGLCVDLENCAEKNNDGTCKKCQNNEETYYFYCANNFFGCVETYDHYCLECNNIFELDKCTKCFEGYELNDENQCVEIIKN